MRRLLGALVLAGLAAPAAALEGSYASADGALTVVIERGAEGRLEVTFDGPDLGLATRFELVPDPARDLLVSEAAPIGWFDRLMGRQPERLPFDGERLSFAVDDTERLMLTTLVVDPSGNPTLDRFELLASAEGGVAFERQRVTSDGIEAFATLVLEEAGR